LTLVIFVASYALASRIDFEIGTGSAVPTQLVLVPMLALLPVQYVHSASQPPASRGLPITRAAGSRSTAVSCAW